MFFKSEVLRLTLMVLESNESNTEKKPQSSEAYSCHYCQHSPPLSPEGMEMVSKIFADTP